MHSQKLPTIWDVPAANMSRKIVATELRRARVRPASAKSDESLRRWYAEADPVLRYRGPGSTSMCLNGPRPPSWPSQAKGSVIGGGPAIPAEHAQGRRVGPGNLVDSSGSCHRMRAAAFH
jgi:hypothetical protein